jgi:hypothetical protein
VFELASNIRRLIAATLLASAAAVLAGVALASAHGPGVVHAGNQTNQRLQPIVPISSRVLIDLGHDSGIGANESDRNNFLPGAHDQTGEWSGGGAVQRILAGRIPRTGKEGSFLAHRM